MGIQYNKPWELLIDKGISKAELRKATGVAASTFSKMNKNESVFLDMLECICRHLRCDIGDVVELTSNR